MLAAFSADCSNVELAQDARAQAASELEAVALFYGAEVEQAWKLDLTRGVTVPVADPYAGPRTSDFLVARGVVLSDDDVSSSVLDLDTLHVYRVPSSIVKPSAVDLMEYYVATELAACPQWRAGFSQPGNGRWQRELAPLSKAGRYAILHADHRYALLLGGPEGLQIIGSACVLQQETATGQGDASCTPVSPLSSAEYPDVLVRGHFEAALDDEYSLRVRRAAAIAERQVWAIERAEQPLSSGEFRAVLENMYCNYSGRYAPPVWRADTIARFSRNDGHWYQDVRNVLQAAGVDIEAWATSMQPTSWQVTVGHNVLMHSPGPSVDDPRTTFEWGDDRTLHFDGYDYMSPNQFTAVQAQTATLLNRLRQMRSMASVLRANPSDTQASAFVEDVQKTIAALGFTAASWHPFQQYNWGVFYILIAQARRHLLSGLVAEPVDRMSNALDLLLALGAHNHAEAERIYQRWHAGRLDDLLESDLGLTLRRHSAVGTPSWYFDKITRASIWRSDRMYTLPASRWPTEHLPWSSVRAQYPSEARLLRDGPPEEGAWVSVCRGDGFGRFEIRMVQQERFAALQAHAHDYSFFLNHQAEQFCGIATIYFSGKRPIRIEDKASTDELGVILDDPDYQGSSWSYFETLMQFLAPAYQ